MGLIFRLFQRISGLIRPPSKEGPEKEVAPSKALSKEQESRAHPSATPPDRSLAQQAPSFTEPEPSPSPAQPARNPNLVQIGFDFGTSNCKCVCRDIVNQQAWVYVPESPVNPEHPFLLPSALQIRDGQLFIADPNAHYHDNGLPHIKTALAACARGQWEDQSLLPYREAVNDDNGRLTAFVSACTVYLLAGYLGNIRSKIRSKHTGFGQHPLDYMMVNLAIPVADANQPEVASLFLRVLKHAFKHADYLAGHRRLSLAALEQYGRDVVADEAEPGDNSPCYVYPEVSANVQSFVRSPNASRGIYFFCDTGAATVDQCVFIFTNFPGEPRRLNYLSARVLPLGSSRIEHEARALNGEEGVDRLEYWRRRKESNENDLPLCNAKSVIGQELKEKTLSPLFIAKRQLPVQRQFLDIKGIFGGGGHTNHPYEQHALEAFAHHNLIVPMCPADRVGMPPFRPDVAGMPIPDDLDLPNDHWYKRLTVAYGLSFYKGDLVHYQFPGAGDVPVTMPVRDIPAAPGSEVC